MIRQYSDNDLIERALQGDPSGYAALVNRHKSFAFSIALRLVQTRELAEEVTQDSFMKAFRSLESFRKESKFSTWLYRIVYTTSLNELRKNAPFTQEIDDTLSSELSDDGPDGAVLLDQKIKKQYIEKALKKMPGADALVMELFYLGERSLEEIAGIMNIETNTVKIRLHRARPKFRKCLQEFMREPSLYE